MAETVSSDKIHDIEWCLSRANDHIKTVNNKVKKVEGRLTDIEEDVGMIPVLAEEIVKLQKIVQSLTNETKGEEEVKLQKIVQSLTNETKGEEEEG